MKQITDPPRWRIESDGTAYGTRVFTPGGEEVTDRVRAVRWELGPQGKGPSIPVCTLELLAVEASVQAEGAKIARYAYCKEHGDVVPVDDENRHVETLEESVERVFAIETSTHLPPNTMIVASEGHGVVVRDGQIVGEIHRCDGCRQYLPCEAVTGRGWRCEECRG